MSSSPLTRRRLLQAAGVATVATAAGPALAGRPADAAAVPPVRSDTGVSAYPFDLSQVRLTTSRWLDNQNRTLAYLRFVDVDRLLYNFRANHRLSVNGAAATGGWDAPNFPFRTHVQGHFLTAWAQAWAVLGDTTCRDKANYMVAELARCQANNGAAGFNPGYLSGFPESEFTALEARTLSSGNVPYYCVHKTLAGLLDVWRYIGNTQARDVLLALAGWVVPAAGVSFERHATHPPLIDIHARSVCHGTQFHPVAQLDAPDPAIRQHDGANVVKILRRIVAEPRRRLGLHHGRREHRGLDAAHAGSDLRIAIEPRKDEAAGPPQHDLQADHQAEPLVKFAQEPHALGLQAGGARAPETEIQQPDPAQDRDCAEYSRHARHGAGRPFALAVIHDVQHPLEVVPAPDAMTPRHERAGVGMKIERRLQPVVEVDSPQRRRPTAHFHRDLVFEQRHGAQLTVARVVAARELANQSDRERR
jgi:hypothetical protein